MLAFGIITILLASPPPTLPVYPVLIQPDKQTYSGKDLITVTLKNEQQKAVWVAPYVTMERSNGDGSWTSVYKLRTVDVCHTSYRPPKPVCRRLEAKTSLKLAPWDWNTGGYDQCPPRRPGHRAFKGVYRLTLDFCSGKAPKNGKARTKLVTWE